MSRYDIGRSLLVAALGCVAAFYVGAAARVYVGGRPPAAYAEDTEPEAVAERLWVNGDEQGVVNVGEDELLLVRTGAGGLTGYERAMIVAKRINDGLVGGIVPEDVRGEQEVGMWVVKMGDVTLVTANPDEAEELGLTRAELAAQWANQIVLGLFGSPAPEEIAEEEPGEEVTEVLTEEPVEVTEEVPELAEETVEPLEEVVEEWQPPEPYRNKIVPILSVLDGTRLGVARINGPRSAVDTVQAVAQLETNYRSALEIDVYVPIATRVPGTTLARVQGVGVTGLADYRF